MQKGSKHSDEAREKMKKRAQQREAPVVRYRMILEEYAAWCKRWPNARAALERSAQSDDPKKGQWARELVELLSMCDVFAIADELDH